MISIDKRYCIAKIHQSFDLNSAKILSKPISVHGLNFLEDFISIKLIAMLLIVYSIFPFYQIVVIHFFLFTSRIFHTFGCINSILLLAGTRIFLFSYSLMYFSLPNIIDKIFVILCTENGTLKSTETSLL